MQMVLQMMAALSREDGQGLAEYGMIIALVAVAAIAGVTAFGTDISSFLAGLGSQFSF